MVSAGIAGFLDIDLEVHARYLPSVILAIKNGADVAIVRRTFKFNLFAAHRYILSRGYNFLVKKLLKLPFNDTESGLKFFKRSKILPILERVTNKGWFWDTEIMFNVFKHNLSPIEIPGLFLRDRNKKSTVKIFKDSWEYFYNLLSLTFKQKKL